MKRPLIFILLAICLFSACERRSGRKTAGERNRTTLSHDRKISSPTSLKISDKFPKISTSKIVLSGPDIFEKYSSSVFMVFTSDGWSDFQGSGFFISDSGIGVSNYHVFKGTTIGFENIKLTDGRIFKVEKVIGYSENEDYILFKVAIGNQRVNYIPMSNSMPKVGEKAYAIGSPRGLENTFSSGEISQIRNGNILQISVPIDHGSSGGALINSYGEAIGITTAGLDDSGANLNFAMSIKVIDKHIRSIVR